MISRIKTWVVYEALERGKPCGTNAVCDQLEWDEMERLRPGVYPLIKAGIVSEAEAEHLARDTKTPKPEKLAKTK